MYTIYVMETPNRTPNQSRKTIQLAPQVHECLMSRLTRYRAEVGYHASLNELVTHILRLDEPTEIMVRIEPVELRADGASLRSVMQVDNYRLTATR